jgi:hypothetical protein
MENKFRPLSKKEESIAREIGDAAYQNNLINLVSWCLRGKIAE